MRNGKKQKFDPKPIIQELERTGLVNSPIFQTELAYATRTNNWRRLTHKLRLVRKKVQRAQQEMLIEAEKMKIDPYHPRPAPEEFDGEISMALILDPETGEPVSEFFIRIKDLVRHMALFGMTGYGKTNAIIHIINNIRFILGNNVVIWILDPKRTYRRDIDFIPLSFRDFRDDIFEPPTESVNLFEWVSVMNQNLATELYYQTASKSALNRVCYEIVTETSQFPRTDTILEKLAKHRKLAGRNFREIDPIITLENRMEDLKRFEEQSRLVKIPFKDLTTQNLIFEWGIETSETRMMRIVSLLTKLFTVKQYEPSDTIHLVILEEARRLVAHRSYQFGEPILETLATLVRQSNIGLIYVTQEPASMAPVFKSNVSTMIGLPLLEGRQIRDMAATLGISGEQFNYFYQLSAAGEGHAVARYTRINRPFPIYFPLANSANRTDEIINQEKEAFLKPYIYTEPQPIEPAQANTKQQQPIQKQQPKKIAPEIPDNSDKILKALKKDPFLNTNERKTATNLTGRPHQNAEEWLESNGYVKAVKFKSKKRAPAGKFLELTDKAYRYLGIPKPSWGRESLQHRYYKKCIKESLKADGWKAKIEALTTVPKSGHKFDVLAEKDTECIAYEVTISDKNLTDNIQKAFDDKRITKLVIVAEDQKSLTKLKKIANAEIQNYGKRLEFKPIMKWLS